MKPDFYKLKPEYEGISYPWPCESQPSRTIQLFDDDVLTKQDDGKYSKHTGLGCFGIEIPDEHLDGYEGWPAMTIDGVNLYGEPKPVRKIESDAESA